jgi:hypothetical protein
VTAAVPLALHDCGPCDTAGPAVRDHLPPWLSPEGRAFILTRLDAGRARYGADLRIGWGPALVELAQELADAVAYAVAGGLPEGLTRDLCAALDTALRLAQPQPTKEPTMPDAPETTETNADAELFDRLAAAARDGSLVAYAIAVQTVDPGRKTVTMITDFVVNAGDDGNFDAFAQGFNDLTGKVGAYVDAYRAANGDADPDRRED